jgi:hypothetical protein
MTLEDAVRLLMPAGELGDEVHEVILECQRKGLIRIKEDGTLALTEDGRRIVDAGSEDQNEEAA